MKSKNSKPLYNHAEDNRWLPVAEAAKLAGVTRQAVYDRIKRGTIDVQEPFQLAISPSKQIGKEVRPCDLVTKKSAGGRPETAGINTGYDKALLYVSQRYLFNREWSGLIKNVPQAVIDQAEADYMAKVEATK